MSRLSTLNFRAQNGQNCNVVKMRLFQTTVIHMTTRLFNVSFLSSRLGNHHGLTGFPGLFLAALTAQSLSLVSTGYNKILTNLWNLLKVVRIHTVITLSPSKGTVVEIYRKSLIQHCERSEQCLQKFIKNAKNGQFWRFSETWKMRLFW